MTTAPQMQETQTKETGAQQSAPPIDLSDGKMKILRAVTTLLEDPSVKITVNRIAKQISVTEAALYRHYRSKEEIFTALLAYTESHFMVPLFKAQQQTGRPLESRFFDIFEAYMTFLDHHPGLSRLLLGQANTEAAGVSEKVMLLHGKMRSQLALLVKRSWADDRPVANPYTPDQVADVFYSMVMSAALASTMNLPQLEWDARWQAFKTAIFRVSGNHA